MGLLWAAKEGWAIWRAAGSWDSRSSPSLLQRQGEVKKAKTNPVISLISSHLICHDSSHGPANLMVLMGFSSWSKQNKQEPGQEKQNEREEHTWAQRVPKGVPRSSQPRAHREGGQVGSPTPVMYLKFIKINHKFHFWANFHKNWPMCFKATAGKGETKVRTCGWEKRSCSQLAWFPRDAKLMPAI